MERSKTNSMTHLVKILIEEELWKVIPEIKDRLLLLEAKKDDLENAGSSWDIPEDRKLYQELDYFITCAAQRHKRSTGAIHARIKKIYTNDVQLRNEA